MEQAYEYITFGEIQKYKTDYWNRLGMGIGFKETIQALSDAGKIHYDIPNKPDFLTWDLESTDQFLDLTGCIPIALSEIRSVEKEILDHVSFLKTLNEVQIGLESVYTVEEYVSIGYFTMIYVLSGSCILHLPERKIEMKKGELCILPPEMPFYAFTTPYDIVINISSDRVHFEEEFQALLYHDNPLSAFFRHCLFERGEDILFFMIPPTKNLKSILQHLFQEFVHRDAYSHALFYDYLQILYANIIRSSQNTKNYYENKEAVSVTTLMPAILEYITDNFFDLTLEKLAAQFHYDPAYLSRALKLHTGQNYAVIVSELKLKEASRLLQDSALDINSVAKRCGYHTISHFGYAFKQKYGISASAYRKQVLKQIASPKTSISPR